MKMLKLLHIVQEENEHGNQNPNNIDRPIETNFKQNPLDT